MKKILPEQISKFVTTFFFLMLFWFLFTLSVDPFSISLGAAFSLAIAAFTYSFFIEGKDHLNLKSIPLKALSTITYLMVLLVEIYVGAFRVIYCVVTQKINPGIVVVKTKLPSELARVLLANSITLTPGTVTLDMNTNQLTIHWIDIKTNQAPRAAKIIKGRFERALGRIFK